MKNNKHIQSFKEHQENLNISDVSDSEYSFEIIEGEENIFELYLQDELIGQSKFSNPEKSSYFREKSIEIFDLEIHEEFRAKGYSKILLEKLLNYLSNFTKLVEIHVKEDNEIAYNLYKSFGFETYFSNYGYLSMFKEL
jgi:ribosomal protein S18 acetylase RimI-like enzyme